MMTNIDLHEEYRLLTVFYEAAEGLLEASDEMLYTSRADQSAWSPAQHLQHTFIASGSMMKAAQMICKGDARVIAEGAPNRVGEVVLRAGRMLRGKARAPAFTQPPAEPGRDELRASLARNREKLSEIEDLLAEMPKAQGCLEHPFLGCLNAAQWLRVVRIHAEHHLRIIQDLTNEATA